MFIYCSLVYSLFVYNYSNNNIVCIGLKLYIKIKIVFLLIVLLVVISINTKKRRLLTFFVIINLFSY